MMLVMIPHIERDDIQYAIVTERLLFFIMGKIMFLDPTGAHGMQSHGKEKAKQEIYDCFRAKDHPDSSNKERFCGKIQRHPFVKRLNLPEPGDTEHLEYRIK